MVTLSIIDSNVSTGSSVVVKDTLYIIFSKENNVVRDVLLFDEQFKVTCDQIETGIRKGLMISNNIRYPLNVTYFYPCFIYLC